MSTVFTLKDTQNVFQQLINPINRQKICFGFWRTSNVYMISDILYCISKFCEEKDQFLNNNAKDVILTKDNTVATVTNSNPQILPDILLSGTAVINTTDPNYNKFEWVITFNNIISKSRMMILDCGVEIEGKHSCYIWFHTLHVLDETQVKIVIDFQEKQMSLLDRNDKLHR
eukprot:165742_1